MLLEYHPDLLQPLTDLYSAYCDPARGLHPFPPEHWEAVFARPELNPRRDIIIATDPDHADAGPAAFCWLYSKHAPSHVYLRGPYFSPDRPDTPRLLDLVFEEVVRRVREFCTGHMEGRSLYPQWEEAFGRAGFLRMGAYERWRLFPLKGNIALHDPPRGGAMRRWKGLGDVPILMDLFAKSFSDHWDYMPPKREDILEIVRARHFNPELVVFGYEEGGPVGFIFGESMPDHTMLTLESMYLAAIGVNPVNRGGGWGKALLSRWLRAVYDSGSRAVELDVDEENPAAKALYDSFDFRYLRTEAVWRRYLK